MIDQQVILQTSPSQQKQKYISSCRLNEKDEPIVNTSNIQKEIKAYKSLK